MANTNSERPLDWWDEFKLEDNPLNLALRSTPRTLHVPPPEVDLPLIRSSRRFTNETISYNDASSAFFPRTALEIMSDGLRNTLSVFGKNMENAFMRGVDIQLRTNSDVQRRKETAKSKGAKSYLSSAQMSFLGEQVDIGRSESKFLKKVDDAQGLFFEIYGFGAEKVIRQVLTQARVSVGRKKAGEFHKRSDGIVIGAVPGAFEFKSFSSRRYSTEQQLFELSCLAWSWTVFINNEQKTRSGFKNKVTSKVPFGNVVPNLEGTFAIFFSDGAITNASFKLTQLEANLCLQAIDDWLIDRLTVR